MDAVLLAGGLPGPDSPLYTHTQGKPKAALQIGSKSMIQAAGDFLDSIIQCQEPQQKQEQDIKTDQVCLAENRFAGLEELLPQIFPISNQIEFDH